MVALKSSFKDAIVSKEFERIKTTPRTVDEFIAEINEKEKK
jgi:hypothetical protein